MQFLTSLKFFHYLSTVFNIDGIHKICHKGIWKVNLHKVQWKYKVKFKVSIHCGFKIINCFP